MAAAYLRLHFVASCVVISLFSVVWPFQSHMLLVWCERQEKKEKTILPMSFLQRKNNMVVKITVENYRSSILF